MEPLKQFVCDRCGGIIERPEDGYVIWNEDNDYRLKEIHIVHHNKRDESGIIHGCDNDRIHFPCSDSLTAYLGVHGIIELLALIDPGPNFLKDYKDHILNKRDFLEFFRRVQLPYYEEARIYWSRAKSDGYFSDANEIQIYSPEFLKDLIKTYKD